MTLWSALKEITRQITVTPHFAAAYKWSYDDYWKKKRGDQMGRINEYQLARVAWISGQIHAGETVLDLGCGDGAVLMELRNRIPIEALGADVSDYALEHLRSQGVTALKCDLSDPASLEMLPEVDHILMLEVLEHMPEPEQFLLRTIGKARKSVIFSFPNTGFLSYRLRLLFGRFPVQWRVNPGEHLRFWTYRDLKWWLGELDLARNARVAVYAGIPGLNRIWPSLFGAALISQITKGP